MGVISTNSNLTAQAATRRLGQVDAALGKTLERLSTGLRILRASDDPAGLAVGSALETRGRLYRQADRNIRDGLSALELLDGALGEQSNILFRLSELAEQAANGSLSTSQRAALQVEYTQLLQEFGRTAATTKFNGQLLTSADRDGLSQLMLQVGINGQSNSTLAAALVDTGAISGTLAVTELPEDDGSFETFTGTDPTRAQILARYGVMQSVTITDGGTNQELILVFLGNPGSTSITVRGLLQVEGEDSYRLAEFTSLKLTLDGFSVNGDPNTGVVVPNHRLQSYQVGGAAGGGGTVDFDFRALRIRQTGQSVIDYTGIENTTRAQAALDTVQARIAELGAARGSIGAAASRLQAGLAVTGATEQNTAAALSRIRDVDVAAETSSLMAQQILRQAATAVLAQANQQPALAISLLNS